VTGSYNIVGKGIALKIIKVRIIVWWGVLIKLRGGIILWMGTTTPSQLISQKS
jgi:hypothetical protein